MNSYPSMMPECQAPRLDKPWGHEQTLFSEGTYDTKYICLRPGCKTSMHVHERKREFLYLMQGTLLVTQRLPDGSERAMTVVRHRFVYLEPGWPHRMTNAGTDECRYLEVSQAGCRDDARRVEA